MNATAEDIRAAVNARVAEEETTYGTGAKEAPGKEEPAPSSIFSRIDWRDYTAGKLLDAPLPELTWTLLGFLLTGCVVSWSRLFGQVGGEVKL